TPLADRGQLPATLAQPGVVVAMGVYEPRRQGQAPPVAHAVAGSRRQVPYRRDGVPHDAERTPPGRLAGAVVEHDVGQQETPLGGSRGGATGGGEREDQREGGSDGHERWPWG